ncbi:MAG: CHAT domain-containing protein [Patulibacter minatonensis]
MGQRLTDPDTLATEAWAAIATDPSLAIQRADAALAQEPAHRVRSVALRARAMAALELHELERGLVDAAAAVHAARLAGDTGLLGEAEMIHAVLLQHDGAREAALDLSLRAVEHAPGSGRLALQRAFVLERAGLEDAALEAYATAQTVASAAGEHQVLARLWCTRSVLLMFRGQLDLAEQDLDAGAELCAQHGFAHIATLIDANRGFLQARRGAMVEALRLMEQVTPAFDAFGGLRAGMHQLDRCEVLRLAGLAADAERAGRAAIAALDHAGMRSEATDARVLTAQAALFGGHPAAARALAQEALDALALQGRPPWRALADEVLVRAAWDEGGRGADLLDAAVRTGDALDALGWGSSASNARLLAARIALDLHRTDDALAQLDRIRAGRGAPVSARIQAHHARALRKHALGDLRGAKAAALAGWRVLESYRATLGATELRAGALGHAVELADLGLGLAVTGGRPREALAWAERLRAGVLTPPPASAPSDPELAASLARLRRVAADAEASARSGGDPRALIAEQAQLEHEVRRRAHLLAPTRGRGADAVDVDALVASLASTVLVEFVQVDGRLGVLVVADGRTRFRWLLPAAGIALEVEGLRLALRRLAFPSSVPALRAAARAAAVASAGRLRAALWEPIADLVDGRATVVVPSGPLHSLPWNALGLAPAPSVAPSAMLWMRGRDAVPRGGRTLLVGGPRLEHAGTEVDGISTSHPDATVLTGAAATVDDVRDAMAGASLAHLACHGHFRADNPLFSSLELHDGALSVFELERLGRAPARIVLSACDAGLSAVHPGDELLGLAAALLRLGTTALVASVLPVPDDATRRLMVALHAELATGVGLADALARARTTLDPDRDDDLVAGWAFQVLGAG